MSRDTLRYVYILASASCVLYTGITSDLRKRVYQHKHGLIPGFTARYRVNRLVYYESTDHIRAAVERERQIKGWRREKKVRLIENMTPGWVDLAVDWYPHQREQGPSLRSG
jgi:putative endonuclease